MFIVLRGTTFKFIKAGLIMKYTPGLKPGTNIETSGRTRDCLLANETNEANDSLRDSRPRGREKGKPSARSAEGSDA